MKGETQDQFGPRNLFWEDAPGLLLAKIAELNSKLVPYRNSPNHQESLQFYEEILRIMRLCFTYMRDTRYIHERNTLLESNIRYLSHYSRQLEAQLSEIHVVTRLKEEGRLEEILELSDRYMASLNEGNMSDKPP